MGRLIDIAILVALIFYSILLFFIGYGIGRARLKADMIAILTEIKLKIAGKSYYDTTVIGDYEDEVRINLVELDDVNDIIQQKINALTEGTDDR